MDFHEFGIDPRLASAIRDSGISPFLFEKMLSRSLKDGENVCAKVDLDEGREEVLLLPALQWLLSANGQGKRRILVLSPERTGAIRIVEAAGRIGGPAGIDACVADSDAVGGSLQSALVAGTVEALIDAGERGLVRLRDFGFLIVDGADVLAERPPEPIRRLAGCLLPSWERRSILACSRITVKAKNLAWDLADNPLEISIEGKAAKAQSVVKETWRVATESKMRFLLGLIQREKPKRLCVFCNLRDTAEELSARLVANGIPSDYLLGALAVDRKLAILGKIESASGGALVLTDKGAEGLPRGRFPLVVNYDVPLEPELFVSRLEMLDRVADGAKVVSLACDRYIFGLTAVEQYIDEKLRAAEADDSMLAAHDASAGLSFETRSVGRDGRTYGGRPEQTARGRESRGQEDRRRREDGKRDSYGREDRGPDIRRSIAEATGGSLDVGGESSKDRARSAPHNDEGRRGDARGDDSRQKDASRKGNRQTRPDRETARSSNPYELTMEERMRRYREKYGRHVLSAANRRSPGDAAGRIDSQSPRGHADATNPSATNPHDSSDKAGRNDGFLGKLFGGTRRRDEKGTA